MSDAKNSSSASRPSFDLNPDDYLKLVQPFFPKEWSLITDAKDVTIEHITTGYCSSITILRRRFSMCEGDAQEPLSLLIKTKGGRIIDLDFDNSSVSSIVSYEMGRRRLGPEIFGIFNCGNVQEYIDAHTLTRKECFNPDIYTDIAMSMARVHAIEGLPLSASATEDIIEWIRMNISNIPFKKDVWIQHSDVLSTYNIDIDYIFNQFDFVNEFEELIKIIGGVKMRKCFVLNDRNRNNCLVRNNFNPKFDTSKICLIDYDGAHYGHRGTDLGSYFLFQCFDDDEDGKGFISVQEDADFYERIKIEFLKIYQKEAEKLKIWNDFDGNGNDSIQHLLLEADIGTCKTILLVTSFVLTFPENILKHDPRFSASVPFMLKMYSQLKLSIVERMKLI